MTHVKALQDGHSSQGTSEPITPAPPKNTMIQINIMMNNIALKVAWVQRIVTTEAK